jgi:ketosteroid isomerase-like protein
MARRDGGRDHPGQPDVHTGRLRTTAGSALGAGVVLHPLSDGCRSPSISAPCVASRLGAARTATSPWAGDTGRAISPENVEIVKQSLDAFARRDIDAMRALNDPDMEVDWSRSGGFFAGVYRGIEAALRFYEGFYQVFEMDIIQPDRFIDTGEFVAVPNVSHLRGRDGIEVSARSTLVFELRGGKIIRICLYQETAEALKAVGLEE